MKPLKRMKKTHLAFTFMLACLVWVSVAPDALGFMTFEHEGWEDLNTLIKKVHEDQWTIHYSYGDNCPPEQRNNDAGLTAAVTDALQMWLQPLREYTDRPIVNDFRYKLSADWDAADFGITFYCNLGISWAAVAPVGSPGINMRSTTNVALPGFMPSLLHEIGHIFGLADTYTREDRNELWLTKGGLDSTRGTQPSSIMMGAEGMLGRDDKNGIIYLYKYIYENQPLEDCFFTDYALEDAPRGCVPKYPLIFEVKWVTEIGAIFVFRDDENINVNVQDEDGMTALHHTVLNEYARLFEALIKRDDIKLNTQAKDGMTALHYAVRNALTEFVKALLAHEDILPFLRDTHRRSPLQIARENKLDRMIALLLEHPLTLPVSSKGKLATTWGHLKKRY